ncbi:hypothetical protein ACQ4PT_024810 [Festuca glaucescens]
MAASPVPNQPYGGIVFRPKGRDLVEHFLVPKALGGDVIPGLVVEGVDVFSATPDALLLRNHWKDHGEVWRYFFGARPAGGPVSAPGGCWFPYRKEKAYIDENGNDVREGIAFRCSFRYHVMSQGGSDGSGVWWEPKQWLMKEFRFNKGAAAFHGAQPGPKANMNCVVHKVYTKDAVPPPPAHSRDDKSSESFQEGGSSLPPRSIRPPWPPKVVATPVAPPPHAQVIATPMAPPPPPACSSQNEATTSHAQPDSPNANKVPSGAMIMIHYLRPKAFYGHLVRAVTPNLVAEGVDVFAVSPDALPFPPSHRKQNGEVWGYFFAAKPTTSLRPAHGGCWVQYGGKKKYLIKNGEVLVFRRRLAFHAALADSDGMVVAWQQTRWLMKEYRINKAAHYVRNEKKGPGANIDLVVLKVFTKPMVRPPPPPPPPPPAWFSVNGGAGRSIASGPSATAAAATVATCLSP